MMKPGVDNLFFMGLAQPLPTLVNFAEQQAQAGGAPTDRQLPAAVGCGAGAIMVPTSRRIWGITTPRRHTIQVDFGRYCDDLTRRSRPAGGRAVGLDG